ncbi:MAG: hypothetical protein DHS20C10_12140 [marine bacterium B5-7]|nr:MAG: hypothetical protein DHS20C10_12140 [marine bacterium B5-7]
MALRNVFEQYEQSKTWKQRFFGEPRSLKRLKAWFSLHQAKEDFPFSVSMELAHELIHLEESYGQEPRIAALVASIKQEWYEALPLNYLAGHPNRALFSLMMTESASVYDRASSDSVYHFNTAHATLPLNHQAYFLEIASRRFVLNRERLQNMLKYYEASKPFWRRFWFDPPLIRLLKRYADVTKRKDLQSGNSDKDFSVVVKFLSGFSQLSKPTNKRLAQMYRVVWERVFPEKSRQSAYLKHRKSFRKANQLIEKVPSPGVRHTLLALLLGEEMEKHLGWMNNFSNAKQKDLEEHFLSHISNGVSVKLMVKAILGYKKANAIEINPEIYGELSMFITQSPNNREELAYFEKLGELFGLLKMSPATARIFGEVSVRATLFNYLGQNPLDMSGMTRLVSHVASLIREHRGEGDRLVFFLRDPSWLLSDEAWQTFSALPDTVDAQGDYYFEQFQQEYRARLLNRPELLRRNSPRLMQLFFDSVSESIGMSPMFPVRVRRAELARAQVRVGQWTEGPPPTYRINVPQRRQATTIEMGIQRQHQVAQSINHAQSAHGFAVDKDVVDSIKRLQKRYFNAVKQKGITQYLKELENLIAAQPASAKRTSYQNQLTSIHRGRGNFTKQGTSICFRDLVALIWEAQKDETRCQGTLPMRREALLAALYEIDQAYNLDVNGNRVVGRTRTAETCMGGGTNMLIAKAMHTIHEEVSIRFLSGGLICQTVGWLTQTKAVQALQKDIQQAGDNSCLNEIKQRVIDSASASKGIADVFRSDFKNDIKHAVLNEFGEYFDTPANSGRFIYERKIECETAMENYEYAVLSDEQKESLLRLCDYKHNLLEATKVFLLKEAETKTLDEAGDFKAVLEQLKNPTRLLKDIPFVWRKMQKIVKAWADVPSDKAEEAITFCGECSLGTAMLGEVKKVFEESVGYQLMCSQTVRSRWANFLARPPAPATGPSLPTGAECPSPACLQGPSSDSSPSG